MAEERKRRAVLTRRQLADMLISTMQATSNNNRQVEKRIDAAEVKLLALVEGTIDAEGGLEYDRSEAALSKKVETEFSEPELFGIKTAMVQTIKGSPPYRAPAPHGHKKYFLLPIARELGIEKLVLKETEIQAPGQEDMTIKFDAEIEKEEAEKKVDLDKKPAAVPNG
jgi:hypothetical protein